MALSLHTGSKMVRFSEGNRQRTSNSSGVMNELCDALDALLNPSINIGEKTEVVIGNNGTVFSFSRNAIGGIRYRGEYENDASPNYIIGDIVRVSPTNPFSSTLGGPTVSGVYICIADNPDPQVDFPSHPLQAGGETLFWNWLATWPSLMKVCNDVTNVQEDWFIDGQKKPTITVDDTRHTVDSTKIIL